MVGIGFDGVDKNDPKDAASNVQCIFTTKYIGSGVRDQCHQNWLMGECLNISSLFLLIYLVFSRTLWKLSASRQRHSLPHMFGFGLQRQRKP